MPLIRAAPRADAPDDAQLRTDVLHEALEARSVEALVSELARADAFAREATLTQLARMKAEFPIEALVALLRVDDATLRNAAIETLGGLGERAVEGLEPLLADDDPHLRIYALNALEGTNSRRAASVALRVALSDPHVNVCAAAIDVVARAGDPEMAAALRLAPARFPQHPFLEVAVRAALQEIG